jgi:isocitrate/isopropylmalate dehydrogenase
VLTDQTVVTPDLGGTSTTEAVADAIVARVREI